MANIFPKNTCLFCPNASVGVGEHVWPRWFIADFEGQGPFTTARAGVVYTKRDRTTPHNSSALQSVHVPCCEECNSTLDTTIEKPAKPVVRRLLGHQDSADELVLSADECAALGRWLLKVGILSAHPAARHDHPGLQRDPDLPTLGSVRPEWLEWMRAGRTPPDGFSVYITRRNLNAEDAVPVLKQHIALPRLVVDGEDLNFMSRSFGLSGVNATIVWHPGWPIIHAQVDSGRAVRLCPDPYEVDFGRLPEVHPQELAFRDGAIAPLMVSAEEFAQAAQQALSVNHDAHTALSGNTFHSED
ncbi:hypothetical protein [uncultured Citricoccus sp.]|uniref:hypothetical protein n=1 Tax=uncultured Citricoccus sp. TaxID=614031 RepID=UPI0026225DE3|nr:hypothetical protein [uncultured Citricoccus sp.]